MSKAAVQMMFAEAKQLASELVTHLTNASCTKVEVAGSIRRQERFIGDIDIVVNHPKPIELSVKLRTVEGVTSVSGGDKMLTMTYKDQQVNIIFAELNAWGAALLYATGPKGSSIGLRMKAGRLGMTLNQYGLWDANGKLVAAETEESIANALGHFLKTPDKRGK